MLATLASLGGESVRRKAQKRKRSWRSEWASKKLGDLIKQGWKERTEKREESEAAMREAVARLNAIGKQVPQLQAKVDEVTGRFQKVVPIRKYAPAVQLAAELDLMRMALDDEAIDHMDYLLEWADEEEWLIAFHEGGHGG